MLVCLSIRGPPSAPLFALSSVAALMLGTGIWLAPFANRLDADCMAGQVPLIYALWLILLRQASRRESRFTPDRAGWSALIEPYNVY